MTAPPDRPLTRPERRRSLRLAYANAGLWAIGNGLASTQLVTYLALELGAAGLAISLILATPRLVGLLRMATPALVTRVGNRRRFCLGGYFLSNLLLLLLPTLAAPGVLGKASLSMTALIVLWSAYHLLEYCATAVLWAWLGELTPTRVRGRFIGRRERWMTLGRIVGMVVSGLLAWYWGKTFDPSLRWVGYAILSAAGALCMLLSLVPLAKMTPPIGHAAHLPALRPWHVLLAPFRDRRFLGLLLFGCWFSTVNGVTQAAQGMYPYRVLQLDLFWMLAFQSLMRLGQSGISPWVGKFCDRFGNRPMMIVSQAIVSLGPLFYLLATPERPWWLLAAWLVWIAYAGLNVSLPNLMLKYAGKEDASAYVATFFAVDGVFYALATIAGGILFDQLNQPHVAIELSGISLDAFGYLFITGSIGRLLGVMLLLTLVEPDAWRWPQILAELFRRRHSPTKPTEQIPLAAEVSK